MEEAPLLSIVAPAYNEEQGIREFYNRLVTAVEKIEPPVRRELIIIDNRSEDGTLGVLRELAENDRATKVLGLSRNFGHQASITAGMDYASGDAVVVIDTDLQDPPEVIGEMVDKWREGYKVVYGVRSRRPGETRFKLISAKLFYRLLNRLSDMPLPNDAGDFRLTDRQVVDVLKTIREENRYMRGLTTWVGFSQYGLRYERDARYAGETKYTFSRLMKLATDGITGFSEKPLRLSAQFGMFITLLSFIAAAYIVVSTLLEPEAGFPGYASLMTVLLFVSGVQLMSIGIMGEYMGRTYREVKHRPLYIVAESLNVDSPPER